MLRKKTVRAAPVVVVDGVGAAVAPARNAVALREFSRWLSRACLGKIFRFHEKTVDHVITTSKNAR